MIPFQTQKEETALATLFAVDTNYGRWHEPVSDKEESPQIRDSAFY